MAEPLLAEFQGRQPKLGRGVFVAPGAAVVGDVALADEVSIWFNVVLRGDLERIEVGPSSNVQDGSVVHTDPGAPAAIGARVTIGHGAIVHGCRIGDGALIGMGATLLSRSAVGPGAIVAAGALVPEGMAVPAGVLAMGVPAKIVRSVTPAEAERIAAGVEAYRARRADYIARFGAARLK